MKMKSILLTALAASALAVTASQAAQLVSYTDSGGVGRVGLFNNSNTLLLSYSDPSFAFSNVQRITTDASGNVYVANAGSGADSGIFKFDIATGTFGGNIITIPGGSLNAVNYQFTGVGFNPNQTSNILYAGNTGGQQQLGIINTSTGVTSGAYTGGGYNNVSYDPLGGKIISALSTANVTQFFNANNATYEGNYADAVTLGQTVVTLGSTRYYGTTDGKIRNDANTIIYDFGGGSIYQIATDGTNLLAADISNGGIFTVSTGGTLLNSYDVGLNARGIAFTAIPEPTTLGLLALGLTAVVALRRRRSA